MTRPGKELMLSVLRISPWTHLPALCQRLCFLLHAGTTSLVCSHVSKVWTCFMSMILLGLDVSRNAACRYPQGRCQTNRRTLICPVAHNFTGLTILLKLGLSLGMSVMPLTL